MKFEGEAEKGIRQVLAIYEALMHCPEDGEIIIKDEKTGEMRKFVRMI